MECQGHGNGNVHAKHSDVDAIDKFACRIPVAREDGDPIAELVLARKCDRVLEALGADYRQNGAKDLLPVDANLG